MKKKILKILGIISVLIMVATFCSAQETIKSIDENREAIYSMGVIWGGILIISALLMFGFKTSGISLTEERSEKIKNIIQEIMYIYIIITAIIGFIYLGKAFEFLSLVVVPIIGFAISIILRLIKSKQISNIICSVTTIFICVLVGVIIGPKWSVDKYNNQFLQYETIAISTKKQSWINDVDDLIRIAIKSNEGKRKVNVVYGESISRTGPQLENLLDKLDDEKMYKIIWEYDNKGYIENINIYNK